MIKTIVKPSSLFSRLSNARICLVDVGSNADVASSDSSTSGFNASALAIATFAFDHHLVLVDMRLLYLVIQLNLKAQKLFLISPLGIPWISSGRAIFFKNIT